MDRIQYRQLQRWPIDDIVKVAPVTITRDSQATLVILTLEQYNKLVKNMPISYDSQPKIEVDADGNIVPGCD